MEHENEPVSWRVRRWAAPAALAVLVAAAIAGVGAAVGGEAPPGAGHFQYRTPRFMLAAGRQGPWLEVRSMPRTAAPGQVVDAVRAPASAGAVQEILAGPDGRFVVAASRSDPCETRLFRFRLTRDGRVTGLAPMRGGTTPALVAGLALTRRGDRLAYTTAPCAPTPPPTPHVPAALAAESPPRAALTVLDTATGNRRTWSAPGPSVIGEIVWARDGRTLGYATADVVPKGALGAAVRNVTVRATDTRAAGSGLREGRVLFRAPGGPGTVTSATMGPDGRTGYGVMRRTDATVLFAFTEGEPMRVTKTIPQKPGTVVGIALVSSGEPRYACLNGLDAFGRAVEGTLAGNPSGFGHCESAMAY
jgi:hypothetical protein